MRPALGLRKPIDEESTSERAASASRPRLRDDQVDFFPRIRASKIVIHGKYDEVNSLVTDGQVVFELMRGEKELLTYDGGHVPSNDWLMPRLIAWYDLMHA